MAISPSDLRVSGLGLLALILAGVSGWSRPLPGPGVTASARAPAWAPIEWKPSDGAADARLLAQRNTWGWATTAAAPGTPGQAAAPPTPAQVGPWRIVGTADWGLGPAAVIQVQPPGAPRPQIIYRRAGENLPDGRVVVKVDPAKVEARRPGATAEEPAILLFRPR